MSHNNYQNNKKEIHWVNHKLSDGPFQPKEQVFLQKKEGRKEAFTKTDFKTKTNPRPMGQVYLFAVKNFEEFLRNDSLLEAITSDLRTGNQL